MIDKMPNMCFCTNDVSKAVVAVKRGHVGFWEVKEDMTLEYADALNEMLGVTPAIRECMKVASIFGDLGCYRALANKLAEEFANAKALTQEK